MSCQFIAHPQQAHDRLRLLFCPSQVEAWTIYIYIYIEIGYTISVFFFQFTVMLSINSIADEKALF